MCGILALQSTTKIKAKLAMNLSANLVAHYFKEITTLYNDAEFERTIQSGKTRLVIEIPPDFGRMLLQQQQPEISFHVDGVKSCHLQGKYQRLYSRHYE